MIKSTHITHENFWSTVHGGLGELELHTTNLVYHSFSIIKSVFMRTVTGVSKNHSVFIIKQSKWSDEDGGTTIRIKQSKWNDEDEGTTILRSLGNCLPNDKA